MTNQQKDNLRDRLIALCENGIVPVEEWNNDSGEAQEQLGVCWALLKAGCKFEVIQEMDSEINLLIYYPDFFEIKTRDDSRYFYLPTEKRLSKCTGTDWYY